MITALVNAGADIEARAVKGHTPLHWAAAGSRLEVITALVNAGADLEARDEHGLTPLHFAVRSRQAAAVTEALLNAGANASARAGDGTQPWDLIEDASPLKDTSVYWRLNDARFE